jgi:peroxiredoxin
MNLLNSTIPQPPLPTINTTDIFKDKRVVIFGLPGAFTPTCSNEQLPMFSELYPKFQEKGINEIWCVSVNDGFVMSAWFRSQEITNINMLADGSGELTRRLGMLVKKDNVGFGLRSWRYAAVINNGIVEQMFAEEGKCDNHDEDPYDISSPENVYEKL